MDSSIESLARAFIETMGPEWWAAKVHAVEFGARQMIFWGIALMLIGVVATITTYRWSRKTNSSDADMAFGITLICDGIGAFVVLMLLGYGINNLGQPEWVAWEELVTDLAAAVR